MCKVVAYNLSSVDRSAWHDTLHAVPVPRCPVPTLAPPRGDCPLARYVLEPILEGPYNTIASLLSGQDFESSLDPALPPCSNPSPSAASTVATTDARQNAMQSVQGDALFHTTDRSHGRTKSKQGDSSVLTTNDAIEYGEDGNMVLVDTQSVDLKGILAAGDADDKLELGETIALLEIECDNWDSLFDDANRDNPGRRPSGASGGKWARRN